MPAVDWTTAKSNHSNLQMPCEFSSLYWISGSPMILGLEMIHITSEHYTTGLFSNVSSSFSHIYHFRRTSILNQCTSLTLKMVEYTARWIWAMTGGIHGFNFQLEWPLGQLYVHLTTLTWPIFRTIRMPGCCISQLVMFGITSTAHLKSLSGFLSGWSPIPQSNPKTFKIPAIPRLELCCLSVDNLTSLALAWNEIAQMDYCNNDTLCWLAGWGIIWNKSSMLKSHIWLMCNVWNSSRCTDGAFNFSTSS
jgi:hypothetical protein